MKTSATELAVSLAAANSIRWSSGETVQHGWDAVVELDVIRTSCGTVETERSVSDVGDRFGFGFQDRRAPLFAALEDRDCLNR